MLAPEPAVPSTPPPSPRLNVDAPIFNSGHYHPISGRIDTMDKNLSKCYLKTQNSSGNIYNNDILNDSQCYSPFDILKNLRTKNQDCISITHLNINSIRNKFEMILDQVIGNIDILVVSETKIDNYGSGLFFYARKDIPPRLWTCNFCSEIEC